MSLNDVITRLTIQKAALNDQWESASQLFEKNPELMTKPINTLGESPLMIAVGTNHSHNFVKQLVDRIIAPGGTDVTSKLFEPISRSGDNPLHHAAKIGNTTDARVFLERPDAEKMIKVPNAKGYTPLNLAAWNRNKSTLKYLLEKAKNLSDEEEGSSSLFTNVAGGDLITLTIQAGFLDVALDIITLHPNIVLEDSGVIQGRGVLENDIGSTRNALQVLGTKPEFFGSGMTLGFLGQRIYSLLPVNKRSEEPVQVNIFSEVFQKFTIGFWSVLRYLAPSIKNIHDMKVLHHQSKLLTKKMCEIVVETHDHDRIWKILGSATSAAVKFGTPEVIEECISSYPDIIWYNGEGYDLSLEAITQRQEQVYNVIWQTSSIHKVAQANIFDKDDENSLHKAGKLAPPHRLNAVTGAALQMQRELQWYKEVENFIDPSFKEGLNTERKTPKMVFIDAHKELLKEAGQWMKDVSSSCTVIATLIITMAFAGAFTLPGGNEANGKPLYLNKGTFMLFIISDAIALFSSTTSVIMFLAILTARFAEEDFLYTLPKRMTIGLVSLFVSLAATMIAFSATLALVLQDKIPWIAALLVILACIPVGLFAWLQFPLLVELVCSTYGPSIFQKKKEK